jgi:hypothetical protein
MKSDEKTMDVKRLARNISDMAAVVTEVAHEIAHADPSKVRQRAAYLTDYADHLAALAAKYRAAVELLPTAAQSPRPAPAPVGATLFDDSPVS